MHLMSELDYTATDPWQAVRLPYAGGKLSMWVLLPRGDGDPGTLLAPEVLERATADARPTEVNLSLPRWDTATTASLGELLQGLGLRSVFDTGHLGKMSADPRLYVGDVVQQANITVGEKGTEAAAATAIVFEATSGMAPVGEAFTADHPFAYAIVDDATGVPLFEGVVADPSQK
jgi:serpin B